MTGEAALTVRHFEACFEPGMGSKVVIGLIALSTDIVTEYELRRMAPAADVALSSTRIKTHNPMTLDHLRAHADEIAAAAILYEPEGCVDVFAYACTSGSAAISQATLEAKLHAAIPGARLTSPMTGALRAFAALQVRRVAMLTPYPDDITAMMAGCIERAGCTVVAAGSFHQSIDYDVIRIAPASIVDAALAVDAAEADVLFIPCTGLRTSTVIEELEQRLAKPVVTAHQAMLWDAMRLGGYAAPIPGFGRLLRL
jgi:maleate isomerase